MDVGKLDVWTAFDNEDLGLPKTLPNLNGSWYLLVYPIGIKANFKFKGGGSILLPDDVSEAHQNLITAGIVVTKGALAYRHSKFKDPETGKYLSWAEPGDFVVFSRGSLAYTVTHEGKRFYVMPDDAVLYTVGDLRDIDPRYDYDPKEIERIKKEVEVLNGKGNPNG